MCAMSVFYFCLCPKAVMWHPPVFLAELSVRLQRKAVLSVSVSLSDTFRLVVAKYNQDTECFG